MPVDWAFINCSCQQTLTRAVCTYGVTNISVDTSGKLYALFRQIQIEYTSQITKLNQSNCARIAHSTNRVPLRLLGAWELLPRLLQVRV